MTDNEIIRSVLQGNSDDYRFLVEKYQQMVFRTCIGFVHSKDDADDLTQDVFIQAYQALQRFKGDSAFSTWLYRIAVNASLNKVRKSPLKNLLQRIENYTGKKNEQEALVSVSNGDDPENMLIRQEQIEAVRHALDTLPENQRTAIILSKYDDLSQKEIAEIMNTTEGAVEALLQRAKKNLRDKLSAKKKIIK
jgi:RNA polymerase sigma-70 factor (ECF subfamily)